MSTDAHSPQNDTIPGFIETLDAQGLVLDRRDASVCQVNLGLLCNQACRHCHLSAGPDRSEVMSLETMEAVMAFMDRSGLKTLDITGGAPEMNPHLTELIRMAGDRGFSIMLRCNLSALYQQDRQDLKDLMQRYKVNVVASLPSLNLGQTDAQRGKGCFDISLEALKMLNAMGYADPGSGLVLDLVSNPAGAFMPMDQEAAEKRFRRVLADKWGIRFNQLFTFANMPLGRFKQWLERSGNYEGYLEMLHGRFNACTVEGLMCRTMVSVSWDGYLFDCDFNQAAGLPMGKTPMHVRDAHAAGMTGLPVTVGDHCYACTAGSGFT